MGVLDSLVEESKGKAGLWWTSRKAIETQFQQKTVISAILAIVKGPG